MSASAGPPSTVLDPYDGVVVVSFGGPERNQDVMPFLQAVTAGRGVSQERLDEVAEHYYARDGLSPINAENRRLIAALDKQLARRGAPLPVLWGNRFAAPTLADAMVQAREHGLRRLVAVVTSAYPSYSSCRVYRQEIEQARRECPGAPQVDTIRRFANHPGFARTMAQLVIDAVQPLLCVHEPSAVRLVCVTHSIPITMEETSGPPEQPERTYRRAHLELLDAIRAEIAVRLQVNLSADLAYCSRSGPPGQPWLEPDINDHLEALARAGVSHVVLAPIGFVADHMEVVYDLDEQAMATARGLGIELVRVPTVRADERFVAGLVDLIIERAEQARGGSPDQPTWPTSQPWAAECPRGCCPPPTRPARPVVTPGA